MAIQIVRNLTVTPNPVTSLPKRIELTQTLVNDPTPGQVIVTYALDPSNSLLFKDGNSPPSKTFQRVEKVGTAPQVMVDRVGLQLEGNAPMPATAVIRQAIVTEGRPPISDSVILRFQT